MGKVLLSSDVSTSDKLASVTDQAALLWTWLLAHANSWGQMDGSPGTVRARVVPRRGWTDEDVRGFMDELSVAGLIILYAPGNSGKLPELPGNQNIPAKLLLVRNWEKYQRLDRRAAKPEFPMPCDSLPEIPGNSGKLPPKGIERKGSGTEGKGSNAVGRIAAKAETQRPPRRTTPPPDKEWIASLKLNPAYEGMDIDREIHKASAWLETNRPSRQVTRRFIVNWLNRAEKPIGGANGHPRGINPGTRAVLQVLDDVRRAKGTN